MSKKLLRKKLALMLANLRKKRPYYCEVEYLHSDGNQYIDTEFCIDPNKVMSFEGYMMWTSSHGTANFFFGYRSTSSATTTGDMRAFFIYGASQEGRVAIRYGVNADNSTQSVFQLNKKVKVSFDGTNLKVNDTTCASVSSSYQPATNKNMWLFNCNAEGYYSSDISHFIGHIYKYKICNDGVPAVDLIPVLDWNMTPCMYDRVSGKFFYNKGTGNFTYGREIHYVDYIESSGTQYIDTGHAFTDDFSWEIDFEGLTKGATLFGGRTSSTRTALLYQKTAGQGVETACTIAGMNGDQTPFQLSDLSSNRHKVKMSVSSNKGSVWVDGTQVYNNQSFSGTYISGTTQAIFADNFGSSVSEYTSSKFYGLKMWQGSTLVRDFVPAIDENGVGFMFDRVNHTIYDNAGTDVFKYPARETEYIEVTDLGSTNNRPCLNLGLKYKSSMSIEGKYTRTQQGDSGSVLPLSSNTTNPLIYFPVLDSGSKVDRFVFRRSGYTEQRQDKTFSSYPVTTEFKLDAVNDILYIDGEVAKTGMIAGMGGYTSPYESSSYLYMLSIDGTYGGMGKVYPLKIYDTEQVYRDLVPAFKDGSVGMYDKEHGVFYTNTKEGTIICGKIIESEWE